MLTIFKKLLSFATENYVLVICPFSAIHGTDLVTERSWTYDPEPAEAISNAISDGLDHIAGAILLGVALVATAIHSKKKNRAQPESRQQDAEPD